MTGVTRYDEIVMPVRCENAKAGHVEDQYWMGRYCERTGRWKKALAWYLTASGGRHVKAMWSAGRIYENGLVDGVHLDLARGFYEEAAKRGCKAAARALSRLSASPSLAERRRFRAALRLTIPGIELPIPARVIL